MNFRNVMLVSGALALGFGIGFAIIPAPIASLYGLDLSVSGIFIARLFGVALAGYGILSWLFRNVTELHTQILVLLAFLITDGAGFFVSLVYQLDGLMNPMGWSIVLIYLFLSLTFGYLYFANRRATVGVEPG
jgi:hypothetical protein